MPSKKVGKTVVAVVILPNVTRVFNVAGSEVPATILREGCSKDWRVRVESVDGLLHKVPEPQRTQEKMRARRGMSILGFHCLADLM